MLARKTKDGATSKGYPALSIAACIPKVATLSAGNEATCKGVQIGPGATPFTRIPRLMSWTPMLLVKVTRAPLVQL